MDLIDRVRTEASLLIQKRIFFALFTILDKFWTFFFKYTIAVNVEKEGKYKKMLSLFHVYQDISLPF